MDSVISVLKEKLNHAEELGINDLKEYVDTVPLFVVCQQCGRSRKRYRLLHDGGINGQSFYSSVL